MVPVFFWLIATIWIRFEVLLLFFQIVKQLIKAQICGYLIQQQESKKKSVAWRNRMVQIFTQHLRVEVYLEMH